MYLRIFFYFLVLLAFAGCKTIDPEEPIPGYLKINSIAFVDSTSAQPQKEGVQKFSDAWVYIDEVLQGVYEVPAQVPVLLSGTHQVRILPGIEVNGIAATRSPYDFVKKYESDVNFSSGAITSIEPLTSYENFADVKFNEDYETPTLLFDTSNRGNSAIQRIGLPDAFRGGHSGMVALNDTDNVFDMETSNTYTVNRFNPNSIYFEMNYKTDAPINIGIYVHNGSTVNKQSKLVLNPTSTWNKVYINLSAEIKAITPGQSFSVYISSVKPESLSSGMIYFDELKLVY